MLADAQAMDDLVLRSGDQILALLARMDRMILQRSGKAFEEEVGRFHDVAVGAEHKGFHHGTPLDSPGAVSIKQLPGSISHPDIFRGHDGFHQQNRYLVWR